MSDKEATVVVLDVGKNTSIICGPNNESFLNLGKSCLLKILQRKIFSKPKDEVGVILMGTDVTNNNLNTSMGDYDYISQAIDMQIPNWHMLRTLDKNIQQNKQIADWLDALIVAMDFMKSSTEAKKFTSFKIVLIAPFSTDVNDENVQNVIQGLQALKIELAVITNNVEFEINEEDEEARPIFSQTPSKSRAQKNSEELIQRIIDETDGILCHFKNAVAQLTYFQKKQVRTVAWNCPLTIGTHLRINISSYNLISRPIPLKSWKTEGVYPEMQTKYVTEYFKHDEKIEPEADELIKGYMYGTTLVPYDTSLNLDYKTTGKCLMCIGFTDESNLLEEYLFGTGTSVVIPQKGNEASEKMFVALLAAMTKARVVMIARRVYNNVSKPKIMVLIPTKHSNYPCLTMLELYYSENYVDFNFASLDSSKNAPSDEQYEAIDKLIDSMDLMTATDDVPPQEAFALKKTLNPAVQYMFRTIAARAMYPKEPLPALTDDLAEMFNVPKKLQMDSKEAIDDVKKLFKLEVKPESNKDEWKKKFYKKQAKSASETDAANGAGDISNVTVGPEDDVDRRNLMEVGTLTPMEDFGILLRRGESFAQLCKQIQNVIFNLVFKSTIIPVEKVTMALMIYREESKIMGAYRYNDWVGTFKEALINRNKNDFWENVVVKEKLGLVTAIESDTSTITQEESETFYKMAKDLVSSTSADVDANIDDLFEDM